MKAFALALVALLVGSLVPLGGLAATGMNNTANTTGSYAGVTDNATREMVIAENLVEKLQRLSRFAEDRIKPMEDKLPENSTILTHYRLAEGGYKEKAVKEYSDGGATTTRYSIALPRCTTIRLPSRP